MSYSKTDQPRDDSLQLSQAPAWGIFPEAERGCISRWFGKMGQGSVRASMLALSATAIGGGVLSLPFVCKLCGLGLGLFMIFLGYLASIWSFKLIIASDEKTGGQKSMKDFCLNTGGKKILRVYEFMTVCGLFGCLLGYQILVSNLIQGVMTNVKIEGSKYRTYHIIFISLFVIFPLGLLKSVNSLRYATLVSIGSLGYTAILLFIELPFCFSENYAQNRGELEWFKFDEGFFSAFGITFFSYACQPGFYSAMDKLTKRDKEHKWKISFRASTILFVCYILIILAGYFSTLSKTQDVVIDRPSPLPILDVPIIISQIIISCTLCIGTGLNYVPFRAALWNQLFGEHEYSFKRAFVSSLLFSTITCILTILLPEISTVLGIVGGFFAVMICFVVPLLCYLSVLSTEKKTSIASIVICSLIFAIGIGSCLTSLYRMIGSY